MFDTIFIGTSGLLANAQGLRVVGNNLANVNTPGFKSSTLQFSDLFNQGEQKAGQPSNSASSGSFGSGLETLGARINFQAGLDQSTGNPLDLSITGNGFYAIRRDGEIVYTRSGQFHFTADGVLVNASGEHVLGLDNGGALVDVTVNNLARSMPKATSTIPFSGNLTSTVATPAVNATVNGVTIIDPVGGSHSVNLTFVNNGAGDFTVNVSDASAAVIGTGSLKFASGFPAAGSNSISFSYAPAGVTAFPVKLDFSTNVTSLSTTSTLAAGVQDGYVAGVMTDQTIGADGTVTIQYSNGQTAKGPRLALANFKTPSDLVQASGSSFTKSATADVQYGYAGNDNFGKLAAGHVEGSNVDLAAEFSNLIVMQRGYQAASHVISTANDMIQELFDMKGNH